METELDSTPAGVLEKSLCDLLEWAKGNRGRRDGNPYTVPEVVAALKTLQRVRGLPLSECFDADTQIVYLR